MKEEDTLLEIENTIDKLVELLNTDVGVRIRKVFFSKPPLDHIAKMPQSESNVVMGLYKLNFNIRKDIF